MTASNTSTPELTGPELAAAVQRVVARIRSGELDSGDVKRLRAAIEKRLGRPIGSGVSSSEPGAPVLPAGMGESITQSSGMAMQRPAARFDAMTATEKQEAGERFVEQVERSRNPELARLDHDAREIGARIYTERPWDREADELVPQWAEDYRVLKAKGLVTGDLERHIRAQLAKRDADRGL